MAKQDLKGLKDWKKLLSGGFAHMDASFAVHPKDEERAREVYFLALRQGATIDDIKIEAERYLKKEGVKGSSLQEQIKRVEKFCKGIKLAKKKSKAWLITWEYMTQDPPLKRDRIIDIRDSRVSSSRIAEFVENYYIARNYSIAEKVYYSSHRKENPYPAEYATHPLGVQWLANIHCGHNPFISARIVENLQILEDDSGEYEIFWEEIKPKL